LHEVKRHRLRGSRTIANSESPKPGRFEQPSIRPRMRFGDCNLRTVTQSFPRGRVSGFQVKTNFKVPRSYSGLPFTRDAYDSSKLSPSRSLPRFEDDPFTAGHVAMCGEAAPIIRWCTMRRVTRYTYSSHGISARKLAPCYFRDSRQRRTRPDEISILLARTL